VVGYLDSTNAAARAKRMAAFRDGLNKAGFVEGRNVVIEFRWADNQLDRLPALAADLVRRRVAVIFAAGPSIKAAKDATTTIPTVFITGGDPIELGIVTSLNRPGGNVTGVSFNSTALNPKRLELLHELIPKPALIAALMDPVSISGAGEASLRAVQAAAGALGRQILIVKASSERDFDAAFATIVQSGAGALFVGTGPFYLSQRRRLVALVAHYVLPASYGTRESVEAGGLMSYAASDVDAARRAGAYIGRILKGEKPGEMPVEMPTKYELVINLATAKALGLTVPPTLLAIADEVVE
jgi:putative ABC transport system substrate-binding protein